MGAGHAVLYLSCASLVQLNGRVSARGSGVKQGLPGHTSKAIANAAIAACTTARWVVTSTSTAMLRRLVLTLPAIAPTIPL